MKDTNPENRPTSGRAAPADDRIEALLQLTGPRPAVPEERLQRARVATRAHWRTEVQRRSRSRNYGMVASLAAAAMIVLAVGLGLWQWGGLPTGTVAGRVELVESAAWRGPAVDDSNRASSFVRVGDEIAVGSQLTTETDGQLAVRMSSGHSLRMDAGTVVRFVSDGRLALDRGALYVDSGIADGAARESLEIVTPLGRFRDIGTQFEVRLDDSSARLRVREGVVVFDGPETGGEVKAGHELEISADGVIRTAELSTFGNAWAWFERVTPMIDLEGRSVREFLNWVARERGLRLEFADLDLVRSATEIHLNGSIDGMTLDEALESVLPTCRLSHRIDGDRLIIRPLADPEAT